MLARLTFAFFLAVWGLLAAQGSGLAEAGHVDRGTQDLYPVCNQARADGNNFMRDHQNVVFSVWVTRANALTRTGTATLIDDTGIFVTAGHTVHFDRSKPIKIIQKQPAGTEEFDADVLTDTSSFWKYDFVLLKAKNYRNRARSPYPLRLDEGLQVRASFIGFEDSRDDPVHREIEYYRDEGGQALFQGQLFGHSSGALVFDARGRAFALVVKHGTFTADNARQLSLEQLRQEFDRRSTVTVFSLDEALPALKQHLSPSAYMRDLIDDLTRRVTADALHGHISRRATPIDIVHLIDKAFEGPVFAKWSADFQLWMQLLNRINAASAEACVNSYFIAAMGELTRSRQADASLVSSRQSNTAPAAVTSPAPATKADPSAGSRNQTPVRNDRAPDPDRIIEGLSEGEPAKAGDLGAANLDRALRLQTRSPDLSSAHTRLALGFLRRAATHENVKQHLRSQTRNRDYAAIVGNLALAEDLGSKQQVGGSRDQARKAIAASTALGGSSTALQLAASYALEENDKASAAALFAQSWRLIQGTGAQDEAVRRNLETAFAQATGQPSTTTTTISRFDDSQLQRNPDGSVWRALAARRPVNDFLGDTPFIAVAPEATAAWRGPVPAGQLKLASPSRLATADEPIYTKVRFTITDRGTFAGEALANSGAHETAALMRAGCLAFGVDCSSPTAAVVEALKQVSILDSKNGNEHTGIYRAPEGYEICRAIIDWQNTGIDGGSTFAARLQRDGNNGLGYYAVVPTGVGRRPGITSDLYLMFVPAGQVPKSNCFPTNAVLWNCKGMNCPNKGDPMSDSYGIYSPARK